MSFKAEEILQREIVTIVPDTHAIPEILTCRQIIETIRNICHLLIIPDLRSEQRFFKQFLFLMTRMEIVLKGKFKLYEKPEKLPPKIEKELREKGANERDLTVAGVAWKRRRKDGRKVVIVSNDPAFHSSAQLKSRNVFPIYVSTFIRIMLENTS
nr:hypothetical protein [Candidatus Baldrarchaeota archaeon]